MLCPKCRKETTDPRRCPNCGASLSAPTTTWKRPGSSPESAGEHPATAAAAVPEAAPSSPGGDAGTTTAPTPDPAQTAKGADHLGRNFYIRHTDATIQGPLTGAVVQSLYKHRKLEPYWEISEDQQAWTVLERVPWLKSGFDPAKLGELAGKLGEKSADLQRKAAPVVAEISKHASPWIERIKRSPKIAIAVVVVVALLFFLWPKSNGFQGDWVGSARFPLLGSEMVTATISGSTFRMTDSTKQTIIGTLEVTGDGEARLTGLVKESTGRGPGGAEPETGNARLIGSDRLEITFPNSVLSISLNKVP